MIGGEFIIHGDQQESKIMIADPEFPGVARGFGKEGKSFKITDEWYALKHFPDDLHVILYQVTDGMKGHMYERPNFPMTWARPYGKGPRLLHLDGPPRRRLVEPDVPGALARALGVVFRPRGSQHRAEFQAGDAQGERAANLIRRSRAGRTACVVRGTALNATQIAK